MNTLAKLLKRPAARAVIPSFVISFVSRFAQLIMSVLAARMLGPAGFGIFTFAIGVALMGGRIAGLGWPMLMNRLVPKYTVTEDWPALRGLIQTADGLNVVTGVLAGLLCIGGAFLLGPESDLYLGLILGGLLLPLMAFRALYRNTLAALRVPQRGIMVDEFLPYALTSSILAVLLLSGQSLTPGWTALLFIGACATAVIMGRYWIANRLPNEIRTATPAYSMRSWMGIALPGLVGMSAKLLMNRTDILMLAPLATMVDVGLYRAAMGITHIQGAPIIVLATVMTARLSEAFAAGRIRHGKRIFFGSLAFGFLWAAPVAVLLAIFSEEAMTLFFGADFAAGGSVLAILVFAQIGAAVNSSTTSLMLMTGRQNAFGIMTVIALIVNIAGNFILIPRMGAEGAAIATSISIFGLMIMQLVSAYLILRSGRFEEVAK